MVRIGAKLKQRARALGLSDAEVARRLDLSASRYGHYVKDVRQPDFATFLRICRILEITPNSLLGFDSDAPAVTGSSEEAVLKREIFSAVEALGLDGLRTTRTLTSALLAAGPATLAPNGTFGHGKSSVVGGRALQSMSLMQESESFTASTQDERADITDLDIMYSIWSEIISLTSFGAGPHAENRGYDNAQPDERLKFSRYLKMQAINWSSGKEYTDFENHKTALFVSSRPDRPRDEWIGDTVYMLSRGGDCISVELNIKKIGTGSWRADNKKLLTADRVHGNKQTKLYVFGSPDSLGGALLNDGDDGPTLCSVKAETVGDSDYDLAYRLGGDGVFDREYDPSRDHWGEYMKTIVANSIVRADLIAKSAGVVWKDGRAGINIA